MKVQKEINKETFPQLYREMLVKRNTEGVKHTNVKDGEWPFKVTEGTLHRIGNCIFFECIYSGVFKRHSLFAINGTAIMNRKHYNAKKLPKRLRLYHNISAVNDIIEYGNEME